MVNGTFTMQLRHALRNDLKFDQDYHDLLARKMYDKIFNFKFLPPGRGLWAMGTKLTEEIELYASLNNCAFVSTKESDVDKFIESFTFLMDASMVGVGVGFDTAGEKLHKIHSPVAAKKITYVVPDTREGWVESL